MKFKFNIVMLLAMGQSYGAGEADAKKPVGGASKPTSTVSALQVASDAYVGIHEGRVDGGASALSKPAEACVEQERVATPAPSPTPSEAEEAGDTIAPLRVSVNNRRYAGVAMPIPVVVGGGASGCSFEGTKPLGTDDDETATTGRSRSRARTESYDEARLLADHASVTGTPMTSPTASDAGGDEDDINFSVFGFEWVDDAAEARFLERVKKLEVAQAATKKK